MNWSTFWTAASAVFTFVTALIALWAVFRWKKQDELKAKLAFKSSIANYSYVLIQIPNRLDGPYVRKANASLCKELIDCYAASQNAWFITEGLLDSNVRVKSDWEIIMKHHSLFLNGNVDNSELGSACISILHERFVFK